MTLQSLDSAWGIVLVLLVAAWEIGWRIPSVWRAAQRGHKVWFVFLLLVNSLGVLPIIYFLTAGKKSDEVIVE